MVLVALVVLVFQINAVHLSENQFLRVQQCELPVDESIDKPEGAVTLSVVSETTFVANDIVVSGLMTVALRLIFTFFVFRDFVARQSRGFGEDTTRSQYIRC